MKTKNILLLFVYTLLSIHMSAADGDTFTANTSEGIEMTFRIISETEKTARVAIENGSPAISQTVTGTVTIPSEVTYNNETYSVTLIGRYAFYRCYGVTSISIPNTVEAIGDYAFNECTSLETINIPSSVTWVGRSAFFLCKKLTSITIPETVTGWGMNVFCGCIGLESIHIPSDAIMNAYDPFSTCTGLKSITFSDKVTKIGSNTFEGCTGLETIDIPSNIKTIGYQAFKGCKNLASVTLHNGLETIEDGAFNDCDALVSITIPNSVTSIGSKELSSNDSGTFAGCDNLKTVTLSNNLTCIPSYGFYNCRNLESINIPTNLKEIGSFAFQACKLTGDIILPSKTSYIGSGAFAYTAISSIKIPNSVTYFASSALHRNYNIKKVIVPSLKQWCEDINFGTGGHGDLSGELGRSTGLLHYADLYLEGHENTPIKDVVIPEGTKRIRTDAFYDASITSIEIPSSVDSIYSNAFAYCEQLKTVKFHEGLKSIGNDAFDHCTALETLKLPDGLVELGAAFYQCTSLKSVEIPNSVTTAKYGNSGVFTGCTSLESVKMGNGMQTIPTAMFAGCTNLHFFEIPNSITQIGLSAFSGCKQLKTIIFPNSITITETNYYGDMNSFLGCDNLTQVIVPDFNIADWCGKSLVGGPLRYSHHLYDTDGNDLIVDAVIPEGVTKVTEVAFLGCESMTSLTLPSTINQIGAYAFGYCSNLSSVTCKMKTPVDISANSTSEFWELPTCTLYIPSGTRDAYIAAGWTENIFKGGIVEFDCRDEQSLDLTALPSKTYGDAAYTLPEKTKEGLTLTWTSNNTSVATISGNALTIKGAGTATITATQEGDEDYMPFNREFTLSVSKAPLTVTANDATRYVGDDNPAFTASYEGFVGEEDASVLTTPPTFTCEATATSPIGTYDIEVSGAEAANYEMTYVAGTLTITEKASQSIALTSLPAMTYGDDDYALPKNTKEGFALTWASNNTSVATISGNTLTIKGAGTANITATQAGDDEYKPFSKEFTLTVAKAQLTITANNATKNVGDANPTFTASYEGFVGEEDASVLTTQPVFKTSATTNSPVGTYDIRVSGAEAANYEITYVAGILTVVDERAMNNTLAIANIEVYKGRNIVLPVSMKNNESIKGLQFDLRLPAGVTVATDTYDDLDISLTNRAHSSHSVSPRLLSNGDYRIVVTSLSAKSFSGTEGNIMNITLNVPDDMEAGDYEVKVFSIVLNTKDNETITPADVTSTLKVTDVAPGDASGDGAINVTDVGMVIDHILENTPENFVESAADVNADGNVNVTDVGLIIDIILSDEPAGTRKMDEEEESEMLDPQ